MKSFKISSGNCALVQTDGLTLKASNYITSLPPLSGIVCQTVCILVHCVHCTICVLLCHIAVPPYIPKLSGPDDTSHFEEISLQSSAKLPFKTSRTQYGFNGQSLHFVGFTHSKFPPITSGQPSLIVTRYATNCFKCACVCVCVCVHSHSMIQFV